MLMSHLMEKGMSTMKKNTKLISALALLAAGLALPACAGGPTDSESDVPSSETTCPTPDKNEFAVVETLGEGAKVEFVDKKETYLAGSEVAFRVVLLDERHAVESVSIDGKALHADEDGQYTFVMANRDVQLEVKTIVLGEEGLLNITPFTKETLPAVKDIAGLKAMIEGSFENSPKFFKEASFRTSTTSSSPTSDSYDYHIVAGINQVLNLDGSYVSYSSPEVNVPVHNQTHIENGRLIESKSKVSYSGIEETVNILSIGAEGDLTEEEAASRVASYDYYDALKQNYLDSYAFTWSNAQFKTSVSEDKTLATVNVALAEVDSYSGYVRMIDLDLEIDGDSFVHAVRVADDRYALDDYNEGTGLVEGATPLEESDFVYEAIRGYKTPLEIRSDLDDYVMNDYDVTVISEFNGKKTFLKNGGEVYGNSRLSFQFLCHDKTGHFLVKPTFVGVKEGEGYLGAYGNEVVKLGDFTLLFDNGLGEIKEVPMTAIEPLPTAISVTAASSSVFVNATTEVTVAITPSTASQSVKLEKGADSVGVDIVETAPGKYNVTPKEVGNVVLTASSLANPELTKNLTLTSIEKPTYDSINNLLKTKTFQEKGVSYGEPFRVNFNEDGTGVLARREYSYDDYDYVMQYSYFNYVLDPETLAFEITKKEGGSLSYDVVGVPLVTTLSFTIEIDYGYQVKAVEFEPIERQSL